MVSNKKDWVATICIDTTLSEEEIVKPYVIMTSLLSTVKEFFALTEAQMMGAYSNSSIIYGRSASAHRALCRTVIGGITVVFVSKPL